MDLHTRTHEEDPTLEVTTRFFRWRDVTVPKDFTFDGASTPRPLWSILPPFKRTKKAALVHDYLCRHAKTPSERKVADRAFSACLEDTSGLSQLRIKLGYLGVRVGAFFGFGVRYPHWTDIFKRRTKR